MLAADDKRVPQLHHVDRGTGDAAEVEELRLAVHPVVVVDGHFGNPEARVGDLLHQLEADHPAVLLERDRVEDLPAHETEIAVDIPHLKAEEQLHRVVIETADQDAVERIRAAIL